MARGWGEREEIRKYSEMIKGNDVNLTWGPFLYPQRYAHSIFTKAIMFCVQIMGNTVTDTNLCRGME